MGKACISRFCQLFFLQALFPKKLIIFTRNIQQRYKENSLNIVQFCVNGMPARLVFLRAHLAVNRQCLLCLPFQMFPLPSKTFRGNVCTYCYLCCSPHPATDNSKCGWVICSQIALLVPCNTRSWHRREQLSQVREHTEVKMLLSYLFLSCTKLEPSETFSNWYIQIYAPVKA